MSGYNGSTWVFFDGVNYTDGRQLHLSAFQRHSTIPIIICAVISGVSVLSLLTYLAVSELKWWLLTKRDRDIFDRYRHRPKFKSQGYFWLINLFVADLLQSIGWALSAYPLTKDALWPGFACDVQGFFINMGDVASSIWSLVIATHTFLLLAGGQRARAWASEKTNTGKARWVFCILLWSSVFFLSIIGPVVIERIYTWKGPFYNGAGAGWCWIGQNYPYERIFFHYSNEVFIFIDMGALVILYLMVFIYIRLQLRRFNEAIASSNPQPSTSHHQYEMDRWQVDLEAGGAPPVPVFNNGSQIMTTKMVSVVVEDRVPPPLPIQGIPAIMGSQHSQAHLRPTTSRNETYRAARKRMMNVARSLLWYPLVYLCLTTPITIGRLATYGGHHWGEVCIFIGASIYACAGFCNVLLYTATRKGIIQFTWCGWNRKTKQPKKRQPPVKSNTSHYPGFGTDRAVPTAIPPAAASKLGLGPLKAAASRSTTSLASTIPPSPLSRTNSPRPSKSSKRGYELDGVDFTHATGFETDERKSDEKVVHDKYCIQSRLDEGSQSSGTIVCTCKVPPNIAMDDY